MRRTIMRGFVLVGIGTLGLTGTAMAAGAATGGHESPGTGARPGPSTRTAFPSPTGIPTTATASPSRTGSATSTGSRSPGRTPTVTPSTTAPTRVRLHTALIGAHSSRAGYAIRVRATGGVAHRVHAAIAVRPRGARFTRPAACHGRAKITCRLGDVHKGRTLRFHQRPGHPARRLTIAVTVTAANATARKTTMVLLRRSAPQRTVRRVVPRYAPPETIIQRELRTVAGPALPPPTAPPATIFSPPGTAGDPVDQNMAGGPAKPRLPVIAPRPGPRPTPNGAPVTVRPIADGHAITGNASGMPTRTILGLLAAAASFVGLVTALVLIRRRNET